MMEYRVGMKLVQKPENDERYPDWAGVVLTVVEDDGDYIYFTPSVNGRKSYGAYILDTDFMISKPRILENE